MPRRRRFLAGLASSWITTLVTVASGLASVPLALGYLSVEEFGLFMLISQIGGYFNLIELGIAGATARILVDYKDNRADRSYGSVIVSGTLVLATQGAIILFVGLFGAPWIIEVAAVPLGLRDVAVYLLRWLAFCFALSTALKMFGSILYANKRLDLLNTATAAHVLFGLVGLALVLASGGALEDLAGVFLLQTLISIVAQATACLRLRLLPRKKQWGKPTINRFKEIFTYAKDVFLVSVGNQLLEASQLIIVTRTMGLSAAAAWSVGTKIFGLLYQLLTRIEGTAVVFFSEMMVRNERELLKTRFRQVYQISAGLAAVGLSFAAAINGPFVSAWAEPELAWSMPLSASLALVVFLNVITRCNMDLLLHGKQLRALRYAYLLEALLFVALSFCMAPIIGFYGIVFAALFGVFAVRFGFTSFRVAKYLDTTVAEICLRWLSRSIATTLLLVPFIVSLPFILSSAHSQAWGLAVAVLWVGLPSVLLLTSLALPPDAAAEMRRFLPSGVAALINWR